MREGLNMARPNKAGLDYFELDCHMDEKVRLIEAEFGLKGFAIIVKLYQSIYSGFGYYCEWSPDISVLWAYRLGCSHGVGKGDVGCVYEECALPGFPKNFINEVVSAAIRRNIFSKELFDRYHILTSSGIQKRYLNAVSRREKVELKKEYLLLSVGKNRQNVIINGINVDRNPKKDVGNTQSKEEKRKEKINTMCKAEACALFEKLWDLYPCKKGKGKVSDAAKMRLLNVGQDEMVRAIERYKDGLERDSDWRKPQNGSTFFNSGYIDYLDENYVPDRQGIGRKKNAGQFNQFMQNDYDFEALERELLSN